MKRAVVAALSVGLLAVTLAACSSSSSTMASTSSSSVEANKIDDIVRSAMAADHLKAVIVKVTDADKVVTERAYGESMTGVPATTAMHFRNGAVAFAYIGTLLMQFVDHKKVTLDDTIDHWLPSLPEANKVTLKMLANQTTGYPDYETDPDFLAAFNADPFHIFTFEERLKYAFSRPLQFAPGANWSYAHTNFMILGEILAKVGGQPLDTLLRERVLEPMGLTNTTGTITSEIPSPVLHTFSSERRSALGIPTTGSFYEEATFWNTQWGTPMGANETTSIDDLVTTAVAVGTGKLLSNSSYEAMTGSHLIGFGQTQPACLPSCFPQTDLYNYGLGVVRSGSWILQNPLLSGLGVIEAYNPSQKVTIAIAATLLPAAFDSQGNYSNPTNSMFQSIGAVAAPEDPPPTKH